MTFTFHTQYSTRPKFLFRMFKSVCFSEMAYLDLMGTPAVNMVMPEIQQVTTRSKSKQSEWEIQEAVQKAAKEWVEEANKNNVSPMLQDNEINQNIELSIAVAVPEQEETWKILADCQVSLPLTGLLKLVPRFTEKVATLFAYNGATYRKRQDAFPTYVTFGTFPNMGFGFCRPI